VASDTATSVQARLFVRGKVMCECSFGDFLYAAHVHRTCTLYI
jgi:hypothetical protein